MRLKCQLCDNRRTAFLTTRKSAMSVPKSLPHLALLCLCIAASTAHAQQTPDDAVTPYRPSVSSPAQLPVPGQLELELGALHTRLDDDRRASLPYTIKLAFNETWGVLLGGEAFVSERDGGNGRKQGLGDTTIELKHAFLVSPATAFGIELGAKVPTARKEIGRASCRERVF